MIIGHVGAAYAARRAWPGVSLPALLAASFAPDLFREVLLGADVPYFEANLYSHASPWCFELALACAFATWLFTSDRAAAFAVSVMVVSHVVLDAISGRKLLWYWGPHGLWMERYWPIDLLIQGALLLIGWWLIRRTRAPRLATNGMIAGALVITQFVVSMGQVSQRPYAARCLAYPFRPCRNEDLLTTRWNVLPFW